MVTRTNINDLGTMTLHWIRWADADYLSARLLLLQGLLVQGAALANTAIEKYLKAVFCHAQVKIPHGHAIDALYAKVKAIGPTNLDLNESFLRLLRKAYKLRYPDDLNKDFNIALNQTKLLTQLDRSVLEITKRFEMSMNGKPIASALEEAMDKQDARFLTNNVALSPSISTKMFSQPSLSYDIRIHKNNLFQVHYESLEVKDDPEFEVEGYAPIRDL